MLGLPSDLYAQCRKVLLLCDQFKSYQSLRAVFVTDHLSPFRFGLSNADTRSELVDLCLEYLLEKRLTGGHPVLPIFLAELRNRYQQNDALRDELTVLYDAVQSAMTQPGLLPAQNSGIGQVLFDLLLQIDFSKQVQIVKQVIQSHKVAAFLVHGEPACGQQSLVNRLLRLIPGWRTGQRLTIDLSSNGIGKSSRALWYHLACKLHVSTSANSNDIADKVYEWWQTRDVIFVFYGVDYMPPAFCSELIQKFWQPLVERVYQELPLTQRQTHLVMFLVDNEGNICNSDVALAQQSNHPTYPKIPLYLPPASHFPPDALDDWIDMAIAAQVLPTGLTAQMLLDECDNGIPLFVYEKICNYCNYRWEGELARWLD